MIPRSGISTSTSLTLRKSYDSVLDWLYSTADEAKDAIDRGYYDMFPNGTRP